MNDTNSGLFGTLLILIILFFILREVNLWYWKIKERTRLLYKTNFLLEKILLQLGASDTEEITIEEISTGKKRKMKIDTWIEYKLKDPKATIGYRTVKDDSSITAK